MVKKKPKVIFTFVEAGMGHITPMIGIYRAFTEKYGDRFEIIPSHIFSESKHASVRALGEQLSRHTKHTTSSFLYNKGEAISYALPSSFMLKVLDVYFDLRYKKARKLFMEELAEKQPDLVVSSYYLPAHLAYQANKAGLTNALIATYTPDVYVYPAWDRHCDMFIVNNSVAYDLAVKKGFKKEVLRQVPFVYKAAVTEFHKTAEECKKELDLNDGKFTVVFTSGAYGAKHTRTLMSLLLHSDLPINLVVVCGKNEKLFKQMSEMKIPAKSPVKYRVLGFTDRLPEYMCAADLIIGKASVNTIFEAGYFGKPMILNAEANRLEHYASVFCKREKIAFKESNPFKIVKIIRECVENPETLYEYAENFNRYRSPDGGKAAADYLYELLAKRFPGLETATENGAEPRSAEPAEKQAASETELA